LEVNKAGGNEGHGILKSGKQHEIIFR